MKKSLILAGSILIMALPTFTAASCSNNNTAETTKLTDLQTLMGQKAVKLVTENNPIAMHKLTADPCVLVYNDTVYVYGTNDAQQAELSKDKENNGYGSIKSLNLFCSKDLQNWTDCGEIPVAGKNGGTGPAKWANNSWAPAIAWKKIDGKDKFFLYFADNGSGIGVLTADSPTGPFIDPLGKQLVSRDTPNTEKVYWLFDPAVFVDDDGKAYLYYGGGHKPEEPAHPKSARCVQLGDDMISIVGTPQEIDAPWLFEDSGINKINGKYVYSYCSNWDGEARKTATGDVPPVAVIAYMTSDSPLGPFKYAGWTLKNPGTYYGPYGNNHHWMFNFKNKWYIAYHAQTTEKVVGFTTSGYRSLFINEIQVDADGSLPVQNVTKEGAKKVGDFNPYGTIPAATFHSTANVAVSSIQTVIPVADNGYLLIKDVDFSKGGSKLTVNVNQASNGTVKFVADSRSGTVIAEINLSKTNSAELKFPSELKGVHNLYIMFTGTVEMESWTLE